MRLLESWTGLDWKIRVLVPLILLGVSTALYFCGIFWPWGWAVGVALLIFSGPSDAEKKGYRF